MHLLPNYATMVVMKKHAIIPIFIPHRGCPHDCVFCNQRKITAHEASDTPQSVSETIDTWLTTLAEVPTVEVAFYGGSFTALPMEEQSAYLSIAQGYKTRGQIQRIHLSTRPDYIDQTVLDNLKAYGVDVIELGVQSFDETVLRSAGRGHGSACVYQASQLIQAYGFTLGIQLMIGLPGDTMETCLYSARETVRIGPSIARLYPTIVIRDTPLYDMCLSGSYEALALEDAVCRTAAMYRILTGAGINVIRVGLKSSDILAGEHTVLGDTFHPAFRQLVEGKIAREDICRKLDALPAGSTHILCAANPRSFSNLIGHKACNRQYFSAMYPEIQLRYQADPSLPEGVYTIFSGTIH